jgi:hypothetical protein
MVRVIHHLADVPAALCQIGEVIRPGGVFLLEHASKVHLKSILRYWLHRQEWSPFGDEPVEFAALNFDFHPRWIRTKLIEAGFAIAHTRTVSRFRTPLLKRLVPSRLLAWLDGALQGLGELWQLTPSVFVEAHRQGTPQGPVNALETDAPPFFFQCPLCEGRNWRTTVSKIHCLSCDVQWAIDDGIYDFRSPV